MLKKTSPLLIYFILAVFIKQLVWAFIVPLWHFPDEQAHFAQLQNIAEPRVPEQIQAGSTSLEITQSQKILHVLRDERGNNDYTFRPEFNLEYSDSYFGPDEHQILELPSESRQDPGISEATSYPPLYYWLGSLFYRLAYSGNLIDRVFAARIFSVIITTLAAYYAYLIGKRIFSSESKAIALGILVSFQPMFSFVGAGVSSDPFYNLIYTSFIYYLLVAFQSKKLSLKQLLTLLTVLIIGLLSKQQMIIALPALLILLIPKLSPLIKKLSPKQWLTASLALIFIGYLTYQLGETWRIYGFLAAGPENQSLSFSSHLLWTIRHTIAEVLPWYWGVFKWLGVVLPNIVRRIQMRLLILAIIPIFIFTKDLITAKRLKKLSKLNKNILFLLTIAGVYFLGLTIWDYLFRINYNFSFGIQGRYYFPTIVAHMALLLIGINLLPKILKKLFWLLTPLWWLVLHFIGLLTVSQAYYDTSSLKAFIIQASQYKPYWIKGWPVTVLLALLLFSQLILFIHYCLTVSSQKKVKANS